MNVEVVSEEKFRVLKKAQSKIDAFNLAYPIGMRFNHRNKRGNLGECQTISEPYIHKVPFCGGNSYMPAVLVKCDQFEKVSVCVDDLTPIEPVFINIPSGMVAPWYNEPTYAVACSFVIAILLTFALWYFGF